MVYNELPAKQGFAAGFPGIRFSQIGTERTVLNKDVKKNHIFVYGEEQNILKGTFFLTF